VVSPDRVRDAVATPRLRQRGAAGCRQVGPAPRWAPRDLVTGPGAGCRADWTAGADLPPVGMGRHGSSQRPSRSDKRKIAGFQAPRGRQGVPLLARGRSSDGHLARWGLPSRQADAVAPSHEAGQRPRAPVVAGEHSAASYNRTKAVNEDEVPPGGRKRWRGGHLPSDHARPSGWPDRLACSLVPFIPPVTPVPRLHEAPDGPVIASPGLSRAGRVARGDAIEAVTGGVLLRGC
jgi:hypothetical protein